MSIKDFYAKNLFVIFRLLLVTIFSLPSICQAFAGGDGSLSNPYQIANCQDLQNVSKNLSSNYELIKDVDCTDTKNWNAGAGFLPIGNLNSEFKGTFNGNNHVIFGLYINRPNDDYVGLFGRGLKTKLANAGLVDVDITGHTYVGGLIGYNYGDIFNSHSVGKVVGTGSWGSGGLAGWSDSGNIMNCYAKGTVKGSIAETAGLVGEVGWNGGTISNSYFEGNVTGNAYVGGLVGIAGGVISKSYAAGTVIGNAIVGGLVGGNNNPGIISNSYSTATAVVNYGSVVGGFVGANNGKIANSYSVGKVTGNSAIGGFAGLNNYPGCSITNSYYDTNTSGQSDSDKGIPKSTAEMKQQDTFDDWNFLNIWDGNNNADYPQLKWQNNLSINFVPIISSPQINKEFPITIIANKNDFNGRVYLHSILGNIDPEYVDLVNGYWSGNVTFYDAGLNNQLELRWDDADDEKGVASKSNKFNVTAQDGKIPQDGQVIGTVINADNNKPIANAAIKLFAEDPHVQTTAPIVSALTDSSGKYALNNIVAGKLYMQIEATGYEDNIQEEEIASQRTVTGDATLNGLTAQSDNTKSDKIPILLVPGIMGSKSNGGNVYPRLSFVPEKWKSSKWELHGLVKMLPLVPIYDAVGWTLLKSDLKNSLGYKTNYTLFSVPYDWALPIERIRDDYLIPWIKKAKKQSGQKKVDIIAHSMGGLVVRSYIQSSKYAGDIRRFAMVGTPNKGSDKVYYIWEGGDPIAADKAPNPHDILGKYFYSNTLEQFAQDRGHQSVCKFRKVDKWHPVRCYEGKIYNFLHREGRGVGQLMPIYDTALFNKTIPQQKVDIIKEENTFLRALNNQKCFNPQGCIDYRGKLYSFDPPEKRLTADSSGVQTKLFVGTYDPKIKKKTIASLLVELQPPGYTGKIYKDGTAMQDESTYLTDIGDTVVIKDSVIFNDYLPQGKDLPVEPREGEHASLIKTFKGDIISFIVGHKYVTSQKAEASIPEVVIEIKGRVQPVIARFNGEVITSDTKLGMDSEESLELDSSELVITDPADGQYTVSLQSPYNEDYEISITYKDEDKDIFVGERTPGYYDKTLQSFTFTINKKAVDNNYIVFDRSFNTPDQLNMSNANNKIQLTWTDSYGDSNADVDHYEIYWKSDSDPYYQFLARTKTTEKLYLTDHNWIDAVKNIYVLKAILKNGKSTFFSDPEFYIEPEQQSSTN